MHETLAETLVEESENITCEISTLRHISDTLPFSLVVISLVRVSSTTVGFIPDDQFPSVLRLPI